ncbi:helix-turn-helix domain-containing protein (plasmid) [Arsenophonus sp. aPb]|uniref:helix-turn-helix transcriptional regulator n=1 Tax=Arsenophonus sp. aPb TaxID=3041619 RepID=UPI002468BF9C|nr:helix-turn-helix domain-containing protein [Arsenophonus sp. aPb]WGL99959.1 helix-turn-helix domain-containing protein [Arsenophonus sp. aPb]
MRNVMIQLCLCAHVPCGFTDSEGEICTNAKMTDLLYSIIHTVEMKTLIEKVQSEKSPFCLMCNLSSDYKKLPKVWQFHFLPLFDQDNKYIGTFFHAHEFLFLSPLEYVEGRQPYTVTIQQQDLFSPREWQILFFTMQRFSSKEIARRLNIVPYTVEGHLKNIYDKINVHSANQLREFCKAKGFYNYIPENLFPCSHVQFFGSIGGVV